MSYTGKWLAVTKTPMGDQEATLELVETDGVLTGTGEAAGQTSEVLNGKVEGGTATFDINVTKPMKITLSHTVELNGDTFEGEAKLGVFGTAPITGKRV